MCWLVGSCCCLVETHVAHGAGMHRDVLNVHTEGKRGHRQFSLPKITHVGLSRAPEVQQVTAGSYPFLRKGRGQHVPSFLEHLVLFMCTVRLDAQSLNAQLLAVCNILITRSKNSFFFFLFFYDDAVTGTATQGRRPPHDDTGDEQDENQRQPNKTTRHDDSHHDNNTRRRRDGKDHHRRQEHNLTRRHHNSDHDNDHDNDLSTTI